MSRVSKSLGVKGLRILLLTGKRWQVLFEKLLVFAPNPKIGRLRIFLNEVDNILSRSL